ncbi:MAG: polyhydroxyalkanoate synthesis regulator DNA-binding domain-containing protein [Syntrophobacteraceae bacterium]
MQKVLLKKYANRRLYDTERSSYVTLQQVSEIIKGGRAVEVVDAQTREDVTAFILTQIIVEEARNNNALLPVPLLHLIIQYGENVLSEFFEKYLELTIQHYLSYRHAFDDQFRKLLEVSKDFSAIAQKTIPSLTPWKPFLDIFSRPEDEPPPSPRDPPKA